LAALLVVLSPHLDDAILSCGGLIHRRSVAGDQVIVLTVFATDGGDSEPSEFARRILGYMRLGRNGMQVRREEDLAGCRMIGAEASHWDLPEAIFRRDPATQEPLYKAYRDLFGAVQPADESLIATLADQLLGEVRGDEILAPLAIGHHVDHQILRAAAQRAFGLRLGFYEDFPYLQKRGAIQAALGMDEGWQSEVIPLGRADRRAKVSAIGAYRSQIRGLFGTAWRMRWKVARALRRTGGERIWRRDQSATE